MDVVPRTGQHPAGEGGALPGWRRLAGRLPRLPRPLPRFPWRLPPRPGRPRPPRLDEPRAPREDEDGLRPRPTGWRRVLRAAARPALVSLLVCCALAVAVFWDVWQAPSDRLLGSGLGDGALMMWFLRWTPAALAHGTNPLFTNYINFPSGVNVMWNTSLLLPALLLAPITVAFGPVASFNVLCTLALALSAWCATLAFRRYIKSGVAALVGGLAYGFSPYMLAQDRGHLQLSLAFLPPLLFLAVDNVLVGQRRPALLAGAVLGAMAACQVLIGEEVLATTMLVCGAQVLVMLLLFPRHIARKAPYALVAFGAAAVAFLAVAGWPLWFQLFGPQHVTGDIQQTNRYVTDLWNFVTPTAAQAVVPESARRITSQFTGNFAETNGYLGIPLILIVLFTAARWAWSRAVVRVAFLLALVPAVLSLGDRLHIRGRFTDVALPWGWLQNLPLIQSAVPSRFMLQAMLFCALLLAFFIDQALRWRWSERVPAALLVVAVMVALAPHMPVAAGRAEVPQFFRGPQVHRVPRDSVVLVLPYPRPLGALPMTWQAFAHMRFRMPGGYFIGPQPNGRPRYGAVSNQLAGELTKLAAGWDAPKLDPYRRLAYSSDLADWDVRTIVMGPMRTSRERDNTRRMFTELLGRPPSREGGVDVWWDVRPHELVARAARLLR